MSPYLKPVSVRFLIDTGACNSCLNWETARIADITVTRLNGYLKEYDSSGLSGTIIPVRRIPNISIVFNSINGEYSTTINLDILGEKTQDGKPYTSMSNLLGIDFLKDFDIQFKNDYAYLIKNN